MRGHSALACIIAWFPSTGCMPAESDGNDPAIEQASTGTTALLQAVSIAADGTVWASGHEAAVLRSVDGGRTWAPRAPAGVDSLQFRDVHAFDAERAVLLSAGPGDASRIFRTRDAGRTWDQTWINPEPDGFYDCLDFWDEDRGVLYGDAVQGQLRVWLTSDGGASWDRVPPARLPAALEGEGGFAASGTCVATGENGRAWIVTGAGERPRVLSTPDFGGRWEVADVPLPSGELAGGFSIVPGAGERVWVAGGDLSRADETVPGLALSDDGGRTWRTMPSWPFAGAAYGLAHVPDAGGLIAVGPGGAAWLPADSETWTRVDTLGYWGLASGGPEATWIAGPDGRLARVTWP